MKAHPRIKEGKLTTTITITMTTVVCCQWVKRERCWTNIETLRANIPQKSTRGGTIRIHTYMHDINQKKKQISSVDERLHNITSDLLRVSMYLAIRRSCLSWISFGPFLILRPFSTFRQRRFWRRPIFSVCRRPIFTFRPRPISAPLCDLGLGQATAGLQLGLFL